MTVIRKRYRRPLIPEVVIERGKRLKFLRNKLGYSSKIFSNKCETNHSTFKSWEQGRHTGLTTDGALKIIAVCQEEGLINCSLDWLLHGNGPDPEKSTNLPILCTNTFEQELKLFVLLHYNAIDALVDDNSMEPYLQQGDCVAGVRYFKDDINKLINLNCIVQLQTGEILIRKLLRGNDKELFTLTCINSLAKKPDIENVSLLSAAYIIWIRKPILALNP